MKAPLIKFRIDYEVFTFVSGNRNLNYKKIEKIKSDVQNGFNLLPYCPVIVFEKNNLLHIVDGQHRFQVSVDLELPVYYTIAEELNLFQIATMNSKQEKWSEKDFLNCYKQLGIKDYETLEETCKTYSVGIATVAELLMYGNVNRRKDILDIFREGRFKVEFQDEAEEMLDLVCGTFGRYKFFADRNLFIAVQQIKDKGLCDFEFLKGKIKQAPNMIDKQGTPKEYIYNIERVYNYKAATRKVII